MNQKVANEILTILRRMRLRCEIKILPSSDSSVQDMYEVVVSGWLSKWE